MCHVFRNSNYSISAVEGGFLKVGTLKQNKGRLKNEKEKGNYAVRCLSTIFSLGLGKRQVERQSRMYYLDMLGGTYAGI